MEKTAHGTKIMCSSRLCLICLGLFILSLFPGSSDCTQTEPDQYDHSKGKVTPKEDYFKQIIPESNSSDATSIAKRDVFISKLIERFGNKQGYINYEGLDKLLHQLGFNDDHDHEHKNHDLHNHSEYNEHDNNNSTDNEKHDHDNHDHDNEMPHNHVHERSLQNISLEKKNLTLNSLLRDYGFTDQISRAQFINLCPGFLYMLLGLDHENHDHQMDPPQTAISTYPPPEVWGLSILAVIIISLVGLLGVAVIPIMQKVFYNHLLQFLVALAVGALSGDAMLHLIPHAFQGSHDHESHDKSNHMTSTMKGLCGLGGIYLFFLVERLLTIHTEQKRKRKMGKAKYSNNRSVYNEDSTFISLGGSALKDEPDCEDMVMGIHPGHKALKSYAEETHNKDCHKLNEDQDHDNCNKDPEQEEPHLVISHSHGGHGHSHCHNVPKTVSAIAWMVIFGDGIHNFSDGLAIGAAFASSITGGISTSIAIFCHELPHEIGDFAVLLRAGMKVKQALVYNCVSSILAFLGMIIGIFLGNIDGASSWIFVTVAGMFLYIALVDMLPQVSGVDTKKGEHPLCHLLLQIVGMLIGGGIMLIIAVFEQDMKDIL